MYEGILWYFNWQLVKREVIYCNSLDRIVRLSIAMGLSLGRTYWHISTHYSDVIMSAIASQITAASILFLTVCSDANQRKHQWSASLAFHDDVIKWKHFQRYWPFVRGIHRSPVNSPHQGPVTRPDLRLNKRLSKQSCGWWFETLSRPLWRHRNGEGNSPYCDTFPAQSASNGKTVSFHDVIMRISEFYWKEKRHSLLVF